MPSTALRPPLNSRSSLVASIAGIPAAESIARATFSRNATAGRDPDRSLVLNDDDETSDNRTMRAGAGAGAGALGERPDQRDRLLLELGYPRLPLQPVPGREPNERLSGQDEHLPGSGHDPPRRADRGLVDHPGQAQQEADHVLQHQRGRPRFGPDHDPAPAQEALLPGDGRESRGPAPVLFRSDDAVPARHDDPGKEGLGGGPDGAHLGAGAGHRLLQLDVLAGEPAEEAVQQHDAADRPAARGSEHPVLLPVPDAAPD